MIEVRPKRPEQCSAGATDVEVTFVIPARPDIDDATVVGDFNDWSTSATKMSRLGDTLTATVTLRAGRRYQFKYLLNGERWENDWAADDYVANHHGGEDSVVDLTHRPPAAVTAAPAPPAERSSPGAQQPASHVDRRFEADLRALAELLRFGRALTARQSPEQAATSV